MPWADDPEFSSEWFIDWDRIVIETGEPRFGILERLQRSDGETRWIETNKSPLRDVTGEVIGVMGTFEDVTERRHTEEELRLTLDELDQRVHLRTTELVRANEALRREVEDRIRLQAEERQQRAYAEALRDSAAAMSTTFDLDAVTAEIIAGVERLVSNDLTAIVLRNDDGDYELSRHAAGFGYAIDPSSILHSDVAAHSLISQMTGVTETVIVSDPVSAFGAARSVLGARMQVADQVVGFLLVESATPGFFTDDHADRLGALADQAGTALTNSRLASRLSHLAAAEERQRLARDLHDAVNQTLWTAALTAESLFADVDPDDAIHHRVDRLRRLTRGALAEMRALLLELRPSELADVSLDQLIRHLLDALECRRTLDVTVELDPVKLESDTHIAFYRIAQEALGNVAHHAQANALTVRLTATPDIELTITDDGVGFDPAVVPAGHLGMRIMRERAGAVGADLQVESSPGQGTTLRLRVEP
jgi:signal transduction histidine kinase